MSKRKILIVNGRPTSGKTTFAELSKEFVNTHNYSSISYIKMIAELSGWNPDSKTEKDRKFLSDLKILTSEYSDLAFNKILKKVEIYNAFDYADNSVLLIDVREPLEIAKLLKTIDAETVFIQSDVPMITSNMADANVEHFEYGHYIYNSRKSLDDFRSVIGDFYSKLFK